MHEEIFRLDAIGQAQLVADRKIRSLELVDAAMGTLDPSLPYDVLVARTKTLAGYPDT